MCKVNNIPHVGLVCACYEYYSHIISHTNFALWVPHRTICDGQR